MADASFLQTSFAGGEWSAYAQGRMDDQDYRTGLNVCYNALPLEQGAATRRPGTMLAAATRKGVAGVLRAFDFQQSTPYNLELTAGHLRFVVANNLALETAGEQFVIGVSSANPAEITTLHNHGWSTGDEVQFAIATGEDINTSLAPLLGRELEITKTGNRTFTVKDALTGANIDGSTINLLSTVVVVARVADIATPYTADELASINTVQNDRNLLLMSGSRMPYILASTPSAVAGGYASFTFEIADFLDGPYLDPPDDGSYLTPSAKTGSITLTATLGTEWAGFVATDVGRLVRLLSEPADWSNVTAYTTGDQIKYNGAYYTALKNNTGANPEADVTNWGVDTSAAAWTWCQITAYTNATHVTALVRGDDILRTTACHTYRLGLYSDTTGWPKCGVYQSGRFWLAGAVGNRLDSSKIIRDNLPLATLDFAPTAADGTVADDNAISAVLDATDINEIMWMASDEKGIFCGTQAGEWLVRAGDQGDAITPTSIDARRVTEIGAANVPVKRAGIALTFVQRFRKKLVEYITTDFRGYTGRNLSMKGKHLAEPGLAELAYVKELTPVLWARTDESKLIGCSYKREQPFASDPPDFAGWHRHELGSGFDVVSIQAGPSFGGDTDSLTFVAKDPATSRYYTYVMTSIMEERSPITDAYFVDHGVAPKMAEVVTVTGIDYVRLYSLWRAEGMEVSVFLGGVDCGDYTVTNGQIDVPLDTNTIPLLTTSYLDGLSSTTNFRGIGMTLVTTAPGFAHSPGLTSVQNASTPPVGGWVKLYQPNEYCFDWEHGKLFLGNSFDGGIRKVDLATYTEDAHANGPIGALMMEYCNGYVYDFGVSTIVRWKDDLSANTSVAMSTPYDVASISIGGNDYLLYSDLGGISTPANIHIFDLTAMAESAFVPVTVNEFRGYVCRGQQYDGVALGYVLGNPNNYAGGSSFAISNPLGLYRVEITSVGSFTMERVGDVDPTQIAGWHYFDGASAIIFDATDNNVLMHVQTGGTGAYNAGTSYGINMIVTSGGHDYKSLQNANIGHTPATSPTYWQDLGVSIPPTSAVIKVNTATAHIMWKVDVGGGPSTNALNNSRIRFGKYAYLGGTNLGGQTYRLTVIDTIAGTGVNTDLYNIFPVGGQSYDDYSGSLWVDCEYAYAAGNPASPVPHGTTPTNWTENWATFGNLAGAFSPAAQPPEAEVNIQTPVAVGFTYTSDGQILRPVAPAETGAQNGPALAKTRRIHQAAYLFHNSQGVSVGTDFSNLRTADFANPRGEAYALTTLFSGIYWNAVDDDYSFDGMLCWRTTRPYPTTVLAIEGFIHTQDR